MPGPRSARKSPNSATRKAPTIAIPGTDLAYERLSYRTRQRVARQRKAPPEGWPQPDVVEPIRAKFEQRERQRRFVLVGGVAAGVLVVAGLAGALRSQPTKQTPVVAVLGGVVERSATDDATTTTTTTTTTTPLPATNTSQIIGR